MQIQTREGVMLRLMEIIHLSITHVNELFSAIRRSICAPLGNGLFQKSRDYLVLGC
jgi:hypothetical protein